MATHPRGQDQQNKAKCKNGRASEETEGAKGAQDGRTTATGATTYPRDAEGWIALADGHAEYPLAKERRGHDDNPAWGQGETKSANEGSGTTLSPASLQHLAQMSVRGDLGNLRGFVAAQLAAIFSIHCTCVCRKTCAFIAGHGPQGMLEP